MQQVVDSLTEPPSVAKVARPKISAKRLIDEVLVNPVTHSVVGKTWGCSPRWLLLGAKEVKSARDNFRWIIYDCGHSVYSWKQNEDMPEGKEGRSLEMSVRGISD